MKKLIVFMAIMVFALIAVVSAADYTVTQTSYFDENYSRNDGVNSIEVGQMGYLISLSEDGQTIAFTHNVYFINLTSYDYWNYNGSAYVSHDGGVTFDVVYNFTDGETLSGVSMSNDGSKMVVTTIPPGYTDGYIFVSSNGGDTWTQKYIPGQQVVLYSTISGDGNKLFVTTTDENSIYYSTDLGDTWTNVTISQTISSPTVIASSYDGETIVFGEYSQPYPFISTDGGDTWSFLNTTIPAMYAYTGISSDGSKICLQRISYDEEWNTIFSGIGVSSDLGATWEFYNLTTGNIMGCSISNDGQKIVTGDITRTMYSTDGGASWNEIATPAYGRDMTSDGTYFIASSAGTDGNELIKGIMQSPTTTTTLHSGGSGGGYWPTTTQAVTTTTIKAGTPLSVLSAEGSTLHFGDFFNKLFSGDFSEIKGSYVTELFIVAIIVGLLVIGSTQLSKKKGKRGKR